MKEKLKILWIDDDPARKPTAVNLQSRLEEKCEVEFNTVGQKNLSKELEFIFNSTAPDLILLDHKLEDVERGGFRTGSTSAEVIRETWPQCPILCITGVEPSQDMTFHQREVYEEIIPIENFSEYHDLIFSIAGSFKILNTHFLKMGEKDSFVESELIKFLKATDDDIQNLKNIIPSSLKIPTHPHDRSILIPISRWVRKVLMAKPGFLYDRLWTATFLGIKESSFHKVEEVFKGAEYTGVFADERNKRWWQNKLRHILYSNTADEESLYPWERGRALEGIGKDDFSICYSSGEEFPETVAYLEEIPIEHMRKPMRLRYTLPHPHFEKSLYFEEIRMMRGAE